MTLDMTQRENVLKGVAFPSDSDVMIKVNGLLPPTVFTLSSSLALSTNY